ncbi:MAG: xylulose kinase [Treponema sp.]|jgi:xylulokinase|nr:xylulose kinase [Treponema sp.]
MKNCLGIDIGTTAIKAALLRQDGTLGGSWSMEHDLFSPAPGFAEEDPAIWEDHLFTLLRSAAGELDVSSIAAIGLTGMTPSLIPLDERFRPLYNSIQQNDIRAAAEIEEIKGKIDGPWFFRETGNRVNQQHIFPKLLWLKRHKTPVFQSMRYITGSYDYAGYLLTGKLYTERNWALESGMYSLRGEDWLPEILQLVGLKREILPPLISCGCRRGTLSAAASERSGLGQGIPVYAGTADHIASGFAAGARKSGDMVFKLGGAADILLSSAEALTDPRLFIDYGCGEDAPFVINGCTASSGSILKWAKEEFGLPDFAAMDKRAEALPPGSGGLIVLPYFLGEKTPIFDTGARGRIFGLSLSHGADHIYRAILEAIAYSLKHHIEIFREMGPPIKRVFITNGGSKSTLWRQITADVTGFDLKYTAGGQGSSAGAALLAGIAAGVMDRELRINDEEIPVFHDSRRHEQYQRGYAKYRELYERLRGFPLSADL